MPFEPKNPNRDINDIYRVESLSVKLQLTPQEKALIEKKAGEFQMSKSELIRNIVLDALNPPPSEVHAIVI